MDALVYQDTPLASYFEGEAEAVPIDDHRSREQTPSHPPFAPRGVPDLKRRLRKIRRSATSIAPGSTYTEELLERLRYIIVASQLLSDEAGPRPSFHDHETGENEITTLKGAVVTAGAAFVAAWIIHWFQTRKQIARPVTWTSVAVYAIGIVLFAVIATLVGRRQYTNYLQRSAVKTLSQYVHDSHNLDRSVGDAIRFIQEVEVVARGYEIGSCLPPVTRLDDRQMIRRCQSLRHEVAAVLRVLTMLMVESHHAMQPYINQTDVHRYYDVYEISLAEYSQAIDLTTHNMSEVQDSLKELRFSTGLHALARRVFLCDLLALQRSDGWQRCGQWAKTLQVLREVESATTLKQDNLTTVLADEEWADIRASQRSPSASSHEDNEHVKDNPTTKMQLRRLADVAGSIRALNAKVHLIREEVNNLTNANAEDSIIASTLSRHYETIGTELREIVADWECGRSTMVSYVDTDHSRASCSSSSVRTPASPSPSLGGGLQIVDGGPADALRLLNGDSPPTAYPKGILEEEVFEAVAARLPRKRMSVVGMTREEKMAKLAEERKKRATMQEQTDNTTNMLRELHMVIKHRPKASLPTTTTPVEEGGATVDTAYRVASL